MATPNGNGRIYRMDGIDWGSATGDQTAVTIVTNGGQQFDAGFVYAPYIPMTYTIDTQGYANFVRQEDHFIGHEDLFKI